MQGIVESVRRVDARQDEWTAFMGMQSGRVDALAAELVDARETMAELRRDLGMERQARKAMQDLLVTSQLEAHMARNGVNCLHRQLRCPGINILSGTYFPDLLLIRRVREWVGDDGRGNGGKKRFMDGSVIGGDDGKEVADELF